MQPMSHEHPGAARTVLFVCRHGAAKSVLAAGDLTRLAAERGVAITAVSGGLEPDEEVPEPVVRALAASGAQVTRPRPRAVTRADLAAAWRVVTFNCDPAELPGPAAQVERWDDVPPVSADLGAARAVIEHRIHRLLDELQGGRA